jgi:hypothetical protein
VAAPKGEGTRIRIEERKRKSFKKKLYIYINSEEHYLIEILNFYAESKF